MKHEQFRKKPSLFYKIQEVSNQLIDGNMECARKCKCPRKCFCNILYLKAFRLLSIIYIGGRGLSMGCEKIYQGFFTPNLCTLFLVKEIFSYSSLL